MEHVVTAATGGRVARVVEVDTQVEPGTVLAVIEEVADGEPGTDDGLDPEQSAAQGATALTGRE